MPVKVKDVYIVRTEAAKLLGLSKGMFNRYVRQGRLPAPTHPRWEGAKGFGYTAKEVKSMGKHLEVAE